MTAGPTVEPLDQVRRLTNFSTGRLGTELALWLSQRGHRVTLLLSEHAVYQSSRKGVEVMPFSSTVSLRDALADLCRADVGAIFHAAAVCDFTFGTIWQMEPDGNRVPVRGGKISTRTGNLLAELVPTPKVIAELRKLYPHARLVGWKYEVEGDRASVLQAARNQLRECETTACVANGPAYGPGFGVVRGEQPHLHVRDPGDLFAELERLAAG